MFHSEVFYEARPLLGFNLFGLIAVKVFSSDDPESWSINLQNKLVGHPEIGQKIKIVLSILNAAVQGEQLNCPDQIKMYANLFFITNYYSKQHLF